MKHKDPCKFAMCGGAAVLLVTSLAAPVSAQVTVRLCVDATGQQGNGASLQPSISADGRLVAFASAATNFVSGDSNGYSDIFVRDRLTGTNVRVSLDSNGFQANEGSGYPCMSPDGRFVAFVSHATNLVPGDTNGYWDIFLHDRLTATTERVSVASDGSQGDFFSWAPVISADGRYVAFESYSTNLVPGDTNGDRDVFVRDRQNGTTERVSFRSDGGQGDGDSTDASISADGRYVAFDSFSPLVPGDTNVYNDCYVRDRQANTIELVGVDPSGTQGNGGSFFPFLSADGRYVVFGSSSTNLVPGDTNGCIDIFVRDRQNGTTERVNLGPGGAQANINSGFTAISADNRYVVFDSPATNLVAGDTNGFFDIFVHDRQSGTTERVSLDSGGRQANADCRRLFSVSADGRCVAFESFATNLAPGDTNASDDVFVRDRLGGPSFTSLCDPGGGSVLPCPCSNPPSSTGQGCDNSSATGGAILAAIGGTYLSSDSLVFTTNGEKPNATSIVLQGNALLASGLVFGQGVRCAGGALKRLYTKTASGGSITAPNFDYGPGGEDPTVSSRSAAKGDPIQAGQSRWYLVYYRDTTVLGGCPAGSTFNSTQTGEVSWAP